MAGKQEVKLTFAGDDKSLSKTFGSVGTAAQQMESKVGRSASGMASSGDKATKGLGRSFQYAKGAIVASGITSAIGGMTRFLGGMIGEAREVCEGLRVHRARHQDYRRVELDVGEADRRAVAVDLAEDRRGRRADPAPRPTCC